MKLSLNWLKQYVEIPSTISNQELGSLITLHTAEVDEVIDQGAEFENMVVGQIDELYKHPNADSLQVTVTNIGDKQVKIVCGGSNLQVGMLVAIALPGSQVRWHGEGDLITLEATTIRGENSYGMICASSEIGLGESKGKEIMDLSYLNCQPGTPLAEALNKTDVIFDIDNKAITHRPDLWSHLGFAREIAAITNGTFKGLPTQNSNLQIPTTGQEVNLDIQNPEILSKWNSIIIDNIKIEESPKWLQERLLAIGARPVNNLVDITNFVMYELGQPLHAYDKAKLGDLNLEIRFAKEGEELETLDHKSRKLTAQDPVMLSQQKPVIILGIMGGANSEVSTETTSILLESATFDAVTIRKSSTYHNLRSDASQRFEKSLDQHLSLEALNRAIELIIQICPDAKLAGPITQITNKLQPELILDLNVSKVNKYLGFELSEKTIIEILESLEFKIHKGNPLKVTVPTFRASKDIQQEVDLIEEVIRIYGYEKIKESTPNLPAKSPMLNLARKREHQARTILAGYGLDEVLNYSFYSKKDFQNTLLPESDHLSLKNYLSEDQTHLRTSLVTNLLKSVHLNSKNFTNLQIFEIGRTYIENGNYFPTEEEKIAIVISGPQNPFYKLKGIIEAFFEDFAHQEVKIIAAQETIPYLHPKKSIQIVSKDNLELGIAGIIHPLVQENFDLKNEVAYAEINLARLTHTPARSIKFTPIQKFPGLEFDVSVLMPQTFLAGQLIAKLEKCSDLVHNIQIFDVYEGANLEPNMKAVAYKISLQSPDRTLTDADLQEAKENCKAIIAKAELKIR
jgi:phenylalanyl-tRNA synthetase beta chain